MRQRRILVVEDEPTIAESVAARLRAEGFAVDLAGDGPRAVETARRTRPDLIRARRHAARLRRAGGVPAGAGLLVVGVVMAVARDSPALALAAWGLLAAGYGAGLAVNTMLSPYQMPQTSNPFATGSGDAVAKSMLALLGRLGAGAATVPVLAAAVLLGDLWTWVALPVGAGTGGGLAALAVHLAGGRLDRRAPELLAAVTPRR